MDAEVMSPAEMDRLTDKEIKQYLEQMDDKEDI